jgi:predicted nucleic acid-binding Zn ribbon protein|tara:strand:- start:1453 stop:1782 length:330 start_codon:yes stop_codon:yes gene_type:complete
MIRDKSEFTGDYDADFPDNVSYCHNCAEEIELGKKFCSNKCKKLYNKQIAKEMKGKRIRLINCKDTFSPLEPGIEGTVNFVDGIGTIHVDWDNGRTLGLIEFVDTFEIL